MSTGLLDTCQACRSDGIFCTKFSLF